MYRFLLFLLFLSTSTLLAQTQIHLGNITFSLEEVDQENTFTPNGLYKEADSLIFPQPDSFIFLDPETFIEFITITPKEKPTDLKSYYTTTISTELIDALSPPYFLVNHNNEIYYIIQYTLYYQYEEKLYGFGMLEHHARDGIEIQSYYANMIYPKIDYFLEKNIKTTPYIFIENMKFINTHGNILVVNDMIKIIQKE